MSERKHDLYAIVSRMYSNHRDVEDTYHYISTPCYGWDDAVDCLNNSLVPNIELYGKRYIENGMIADLVDTETGEVYGEVMIKRIGLF